MPEPIAEQIVANMTKAMAQIRRLSGCQFNATVERADEAGNPLGDDDAMIVIDELGVMTDPDIAPASKDGYRLTVALDFCVTNPGPDKAPPGRLLNRLEADIRAVIERNYTWGGLAANTIPGRVVAGAVGQLPGRRLPLEVIFFTAQGNAYSQ